MQDLFEQKRLVTEPLVLHSDNGALMKTIREIIKKHSKMNEDIINSEIKTMY